MRNNIIKGLLACALFSVLISCSGKHLYTTNELAGTYRGKTINYPHSYIEKFYYKGGIWRFIEGDTGTTEFTYYIFHTLSMKYLRLHEDGTFILSYTEDSTKSKGVWKIRENNILVLEFEPIPRDPHYLAGLLIERGPFPIDGTRELKIINKNKLRFECPKFRAPENYKEVTTYKRVK